jgi:hypothetical protein
MMESYLLLTSNDLLDSSKPIMMSRQGPRLGAGDGDHSAHVMVLSSR